MCRLLYTFHPFSFCSWGFCFLLIYLTKVIIMMFLIRAWTDSDDVSRCYLECRDRLCSSRTPGLGLRRTCPRFAGAGLCTPGSADARTPDCRPTTRSTLPSSHPLRRETKGAIIRMTQAAVGRLTPGLPLFLKLDFKAVTTTK